MTVTANAAPLDISGGWFRALPGKLPAGGYFTARTPPGAISPSPARGRRLRHADDAPVQNRGGMSGMDMVDKVLVPAAAGSPSRLAAIT